MPQGTLLSYLGLGGTQLVKSFTASFQVAIKTRYHEDQMLKGPSNERDNVALFSGPLSKAIGGRYAKKNKDETRQNHQNEQQDWRNKKPTNKKIEGAINKDQDMICDHCKKVGHRWKNCYKLRDEIKTQAI